MKPDIWQFASNQLDTFEVFSRSCIYGVLPPLRNVPLKQVVVCIEHFLLS